jgi:hypothetical protein
VWPLHIEGLALLAKGETLLAFGRVYASQNPGGLLAVGMRCQAEISSVSDRILYQLPRACRADGFGRSISENFLEKFVSFRRRALVVKPVFEAEAKDVQEEDANLARAAWFLAEHNHVSDPHLKQPLGTIGLEGAIRHRIQSEAKAKG